MKQEKFYFDSRDGINKIHAVRYMPDDGEVKCVVQVIHGMSEYKERYEGFAQFLTDRGCVLVAEDHLGHGQSVAEGGQFGYFCEQDPATVVVRDSHRLKKMTEVLYPDVPYVVLGHSMGSFILRNYLCRYGKGISGAIIMSTGMQPKALITISKTMVRVQKLFFGSKHVAKFIDKCAFGNYNARIENPRTPVDWLSKDTEEVDKYVAHPHCGFTFTVNGFETLFELISRIQKRENLEKVPKELPIFMVAGDADPVGEYGVGIQRAFNSLKEVGIKNLKLKMYESDRHELLNETDKEQVMEDIYQWITANVLNQKWGDIVRGMQNHFPYEIRWARPDEWADTMTMVWKTFLKFEGQDYTEEGIRNFFEFVTDEDLYSRFLSGNYQVLVALDGEQIIGMASVRNGNHLSLLFVDEHYHHQGIGSALIEVMCKYLAEEVGEKFMSLKAAPYAVVFYRKIGFTQVGPEEHYSGIRVTPMQKIF